MFNARQTHRFLCALLAATVTGAATANDNQIVVPMHAVDKSGIQQKIGEITITEVEGGLAFAPSLQGLAPGLHGFHVHENGDCGISRKDGEITPAGAAGSHLDPGAPSSHQAPWADGHLGDLPALYVAEDNTAGHPVFKADIELDAVRGHALIIHAGGDNYADEPKPLGGGGARVACGVIDGER